MADKKFDPKKVKRFEACNAPMPFTDCVKASDFDLAVAELNEAKRLLSRFVARDHHLSYRKEAAEFVKGV